MSNTQLYRKVMTADRLPYKDGDYFTEMGKLCFLGGEFIRFRGDNYDVKRPQYWIEEIQEPAEEEIKKMSINWADSFGVSRDSFWHSREMAYLSGFERCLRLLREKVNKST